MRVSGEIIVCDIQGGIADLHTELTWLPACTLFPIKQDQGSVETL
jgi:hypothetical protein